MSEKGTCQTPLFGPPPNWMRACEESVTGSWNGQLRCAKHLAEIERATKLYYSCCGAPRSYGHQGTCDNRPII